MQFAWPWHGHALGRLGKVYRQEISKISTGKEGNITLASTHLQGRRWTQRALSTAHALLGEAGEEMGRQGVVAGGAGLPCPPSGGRRSLEKEQAMVGGEGGFAFYLWKRMVWVDGRFFYKEEEKCLGKEEAGRLKTKTL